MKATEKVILYLSHVLKNIKNGTSQLYDSNKPNDYYWTVPDENIFYQQPPMTNQYVPSLFVYLDGINFPTDTVLASGFGARYNVEILYSIGAYLETSVGENDLLSRTTHMISDILTAIKNDILLENTAKSLGDSDFYGDNNKILSVVTDTGIRYPQSYIEINGVYQLINIDIGDL